MVINEDLEEKAESLKRELDLLSKSYIPYFGAKLLTLKMKFNDILEGRDIVPDKLRELIEDKKVKEILLVIGKHYYHAIPFEELDSNRSYAPLFVGLESVARIIALNEELNNQYEQRDNTEMAFKLERIMGYCDTLFGIGESFKRTILRKLKSLRSISGYENYSFIINDTEGKPLLNLGKWADSYLD